MKREKRVQKHIVCYHNVFLFKRQKCGQPPLHGGQMEKPNSELGAAGEQCGCGAELMEWSGRAAASRAAQITC